MKVQDDLKYTKNDEWIRVDGETGRIGITDFAQDELSDVVYVEVTAQVGDTVPKGEAFGVVESVKAAADLYMPVSGEVLEINTGLMESPEKVNSDPYGEAWLVRVRLTDTNELAELMDATGYKRFREGGEG